MLRNLSGALREEWRSAIHNEMQSLREHDVYQEVAEEERRTVPFESIVPGITVFSIKREGTKKVRIAEFFKRTMDLRSSP